MRVNNVRWSQLQTTWRQGRLGRRSTYSVVGKEGRLPRVPPLRFRLGNGIRRPIRNRCCPWRCLLVPDDAVQTSATVSCTIANFTQAPDMELQSQLTLNAD